MIGRVCAIGPAKPTARPDPTARRDLTALAAASLVAAIVVATVRAAEHFNHGTWLVAYLFLVGFLAQFLLGHGQAALLRGAGRPPPPARARRAQLVLWNIGVIAVPAGVFADARLAVVVGSVSLLAALASFRESVRAVLASHASTPGWLRGGYVVLLSFMAASVLVGAALAWDIPWL
jgi:hypothetical protein